MEECNFCDEHEQNDELYDVNFFDDGMNFWKVNIKYCPVCGSLLQTPEEKMKQFRLKKSKST